jgi:hypothetical protein
MIFDQEILMAASTSAGMIDKELLFDLLIFVSAESDYATGIVSCAFD